VTGRGIRSLLAGVLALGAALAAASCSNVLGLDDEREDVVERMCTCPVMIQQYGGKPSCQSTLSTRLDTALPAVRQAWLEGYVAKCTSCQDVVACLGAPPICRAKGSDCVGGFECCDKQLNCINGKCIDCLNPGDDCSNNPQACCGSRPCVAGQCSQ
jgi:hypothetical protein